MTLTNSSIRIFPPSMAETSIIAKENGSRSILKQNKRILKSSFFYDLLKLKKYYTSEIILGGSCVRDNCSGDNYLGAIVQPGEACPVTEPQWSDIRLGHSFFGCTISLARPIGHAKRKKKASAQNQSARPIEKQDFWPSFLTYFYWKF